MGDEVVVVGVGDDLVAHPHVVRLQRQSAPRHLAVERLEDSAASGGVGGVDGRGTTDEVLLVGRRVPGVGVDLHHSGVDDAAEVGLAGLLVGEVEVLQPAVLDGGAVGFKEQPRGVVVLGDDGLRHHAEHAVRCDGPALDSEGDVLGGNSVEVGAKRLDKGICLLCRCLSGEDNQSMAAVRAELLEDKGEVGQQVLVEAGGGDDEVHSVAFSKL